MQASSGQDLASPWGEEGHPKGLLEDAELAPAFLGKKEAQAGAGLGEGRVHHSLGDWGYVAIPRTVAWQEGGIWADLVLGSQLHGGEPSRGEELPGTQAAPPQAGGAHSLHRVDSGKLAEPSRFTTL